MVKSPWSLWEMRCSRSGGEKKKKKQKQPKKIGLVPDLFGSDKKSKLSSTRDATNEEGILRGRLVLTDFESRKEGKKGGY